MKILCLLLGFIIFFPHSALSGEVITAKEVQNCFYVDGKMQCGDGEFKNTYYREGEKIIRTNVFNFKKKESVSDNTIYKVMSELASDPRNNSGILFPQVTRAIGFPGTDAVEIISIDKEFVQAVKSTSNYFSISRFKIIKE